MQLITEPYLKQHLQWPSTGKHILAQYDSNTVVVYQAYKPEIGKFAAENGYFSPDVGFSMSRMTWIKPNFLWMMHRCGWAMKPSQEVVLAIWLDRVGFDAILRKAVHSSYHPDIYGSESAWEQAVGRSSVRLQWDPDYNPADGRLERRAIQIGLRGKSALYFATGGWIVHIEDITDFVRGQRGKRNPPYSDLLLPRERVYPVSDSETAHRIGLTTA